MSDLIDREQAKDAIDKYLVGRNLVTDGTFMARLINEIVIDRLPSAESTFDARDTQYNLPIGTDCISRQAALDALNHELRCGAVINQCGLEAAYEVIEDLPSAQPEPLTDKEQRIFLAAMERERKVCKEVDDQYVHEPYEVLLTKVCDEIKRKVKKV